MRRALVLVLAAIAAAAPAGAFAANAVPWSGKVPVTDGRQTAAWVTGRTIHVWEDADPAPRVAGTLPRRCSRFIAVGGNRVATMCDTRPGRAIRYVPRLLDLATGTWSWLPHPRQAAEHAAPSYSLDPPDIELGTRAIALYQLSKEGSGREAFSLATGRRLDQRAPGHVFDLDARSGITPLCPPLRLTLGPDLDGYGADPWPYAYRPPYLVTAIDGDLVVQRCGDTEARTVGATRDDFTLTSSTVVWTSLSELLIHRLVDGSTERFALPLAGFEFVLRASTATERRAWAAIGTADDEAGLLVDLAG